MDWKRRLMACLALGASAAVALPASAQQLCQEPEGIPVQRGQWSQAGRDPFSADYHHGHYMSKAWNVALKQYVMQQVEIRDRWLAEQAQKAEEEKLAAEAKKAEGVVVGKPMHQTPTMWTRKPRIYQGGGDSLMGKVLGRKQGKVISSVPVGSMPVMGAPTVGMVAPEMTMEALPMTLPPGMVTTGKTTVMIDGKAVEVPVVMQHDALMMGAAPTTSASATPMMRVDGKMVPMTGVPTVPATEPAHKLLSSKVISEKVYKIEDDGRYSLVGEQAYPSGKDMEVMPAVVNAAPMTAPKPLVEASNDMSVKKSPAVPMLPPTMLSAPPTGQTAPQTAEKYKSGYVR